MAKQSAYGIFVKDEARRRQNRGEKVNIANLFKEMGDKWSSLPDNVKQRYKTRAENWTDNPPPRRTNQPQASSSSPRSNEETRNSEQGQQSDDRQKQMAPSSLKRPHENDDIEEDKSLAVAHVDKKLKKGVPNGNKIKDPSAMDARRYKDHYLIKIKDMCLNIIRDRERKLMTIPIYSFSVNFLCKQKIKNQDDVYIPIEIGICEYSLKNGRSGRKFHVIIDSGSPPSGCLCLASDHASLTHKITFKPRADYPSIARNDYRNIYKEMLAFIQPGERTILVEDAKLLVPITRCLEWLHAKASEDDGRLKLSKISTWTILPIKEYIMTMFDFIGKVMMNIDNTCFALSYHFNILMELSTFDYDPNYMCEYHKNLDEQTRWCALSCAIRTILKIERLLEHTHKKYNVAITQPSMPSITAAEETSQVGTVEAPLAILDR